MSINNEIANLTIWAGAGISMSSPTYLPDGKTLSKFVLEQVVLGRERLLDIWHEINIFERKYLDIMEFPRVEVVISSIAYIERYFQNGIFLRGFESFNKVPYNRNHVLLAALVHAGATVMTANFDLEIERAYKDLYMQELKNHKETGNRINIYICPESDGKIIHFHGTCSNGYEMGVTIENIMHISPKLYNIIKKFFKQERYNFFVGYSFSDIYDINMTIEEIYSKLSNYYTKENWICNHQGRDKHLNQKVLKLFGEDNVKIVCADTTCILEKICKYYCITVQDTFKYKRINWQNLFKSIIKVNYNFKILVTIHLLNRLKIDVQRVDADILDIYQKMEFHNKKKNVLEYHLAANSLYWYEKYGYERLDELHKGILKNRILLLEISDLEGKADIKKAYDKIIKNDFVDYENFRTITHFMDNFRIMLLKEGKISDVKQITEIINDLLNLGVGKYIDSVLYASVLRYKMILMAINKEKYDVLFERANGIYYDIGNIDGIISTQLDKALSDNYDKDRSAWKEYFRDERWIELKKICNLVGSYRYLRIMENIESLIV